MAASFSPAGLRGVQGAHRRSPLAIRSAEAMRLDQMRANCRNRSARPRGLF